MHLLSDLPFHYAAQKEEVSPCTDQNTPKTRIYATPASTRMPSFESTKSPLDPKVHYGDFRDQLARDGETTFYSKSTPDLQTNRTAGYAIVPNVISQEKAEEYSGRFQDWLESFNLGYKRDDSSTWSISNLPVNAKGEHQLSISLVCPTSSSSSRRRRHVQSIWRCT